MDEKIVSHLGADTYGTMTDPEKEKIIQPDNVEEDPEKDPRSGSDTMKDLVRDFTATSSIIAVRKLKLAKAIWKLVFIFELTFHKATLLKLLANRRRIIFCDLKVIGMGLCYILEVQFLKQAS